MQSEQPNAAFARPIDLLDVVVIDDSKSMQSILRSMLHAQKVARVRVFDNAPSAMEAMIVDPPNLIILDWLMEPVDGISMLKAMRTSRMGSLAIVPAIILTSSPTVRLVEMAVRAGAHFVLAKPVAPLALQQRIAAICGDKRPFVLDKAQDLWELAGAHALLDAQRSRRQQYRTVRDDYIKVARQKMAALPEQKPVVEMPPAQVPVAAATPVAQAEPAKKGTPRKAVGFGARRVATPPEAASGTTR